jgi:hypothetical protein
MITSTIKAAAEYLAAGVCAMPTRKGQLEADATVRKEQSRQRECQKRRAAIKLIETIKPKNEGRKTC